MRDDKEVAAATPLDALLPEADLPITTDPRSDEPYRALVELTADAVFCFEFDPAIPIDLPAGEQLPRLQSGILTDCNQAFARLHRVERPADIIGCRIDDLLPVANPTNSGLLQGFIANGYRTIDAESTIVSRDGDERNFVRNARGFIEHGRLVRVWGMWRDITARHLAEARLRRSEARLNEAQRLAKIGSWEIDLATGACNWSDEVFRILEIDPDRRGASFDAFVERVHPDEREWLNEAFDHSLVTREPYTVEHRLLMDDGSIKFVSERVETHFDVSGLPVRSIGTVQDITERRQSAAIIEELMARQEALTAVTFDGIAISENGILRECSAQLANVLGYETADVENQPIMNFVAPAYRQTAQQHMTADTVRPFEIRMLRRDGSTLPVEVVSAAISTTHKKMRVYGIRDISRRKALQSEVVAVSEDERHRIGRDLHDSVGQLLFGASLSLAGVCDELSGTQSPLLPTIERIRSIIGDAIDETRRVSHLLVPTIQERHNLAAALHRLVASFNGISPIRFRIECEYTEDIPKKKVAEQLYRITQEGISNALRHSQASVVAVSLYERDRLLHLEIVDDGVGIANDQAGRNAGLGIRSMRYRANLIDASLAIAPGAGGGTRLLCTCPLDT